MGAVAGLVISYFKVTTKIFYFQVKSRDKKNSSIDSHTAVSILIHDFGPFPWIPHALRILWISQHHFQPVTAHLLTVQCRHSFLSTLLARILHIPTRLTS